MRTGIVPGGFERRIKMGTSTGYPYDFEKCVEFHGHVCPGLAIGYCAAKAGLSALGVNHSEDEEVVAIVENDSCAVDAIQVITGCTFGKGNLFFRDWGKQVFTFFDRSRAKAVRIALQSRDLIHNEERRRLRMKIDQRAATKEDEERYRDLKEEGVLEIIQRDPKDFFKVEYVDIPEPEEAKIVETTKCALCGEETMTSKMVQSDQGKICTGCKLKA